MFNDRIWSSQEMERLGIVDLSAAYPLGENDKNFCCTLAGPLLFVFDNTQVEDGAAIKFSSFAFDPDTRFASMPLHPFDSKHYYAYWPGDFSGARFYVNGWENLQGWLFTFSYIKPDGNPQYKIMPTVYTDDKDFFGRPVDLSDCTDGSRIIKGFSFGIDRGQFALEVEAKKGIGSAYDIDYMHEKIDFLKSICRGERARYRMMAQEHLTDLQEYINQTLPTGFTIPSAWKDKLAALEAACTTLKTKTVQEVIN